MMMHKELDRAMRRAEHKQRAIMMQKVGDRFVAGLGIAVLFGFGCIAYMAIRGY